MADHGYARPQRFEGDEGERFAGRELEQRPSPGQDVALDELGDVAEVHQAGNGGQRPSALAQEDISIGVGVNGRVAGEEVEELVHALLRRVSSAIDEVTRSTSLPAVLA